MAEEKGVGIIPQIGKVDQVAAREARDDEKVKSEQQGSGGTLERYINFLSAINFGFILQCSWEAAAVTFQFSLSNGGPASMVYGSLFAGIGTALVALSLAEMASIDPTVGAQYRWSATFAPGWNRFFGLLQAWITVSAWICSCTSNPALVSNIVVGMAIFNNSDYIPARWHITLLMWGITIFPFLANFWFKKLLYLLEAVGAICHIVFFIVSIVTLLALADRSSAEYVFKTLTHDVSGWENPAVAWGIGLLTVTYPLTGFDGVLHMSDEVKLARIRVPRSMVASVIMNAIMQFTYMITLLVTIGDVQRISSTQTTLPIIELCYQATGSKAATNLFVFMLAFIIFISFFNVFASVSRLLWAFARDNGLPFSNAFKYIHPTLRMPLNALILIATCICLLALVNIGSSTAFNALISLPAIALYISYLFPILPVYSSNFDGTHEAHSLGSFQTGESGAFY